MENRGRLSDGDRVHKAEMYVTVFLLLLCECFLDQTVKERCWWLLLPQYVAWHAKKKNLTDCVTEQL